MTDWTINSIRIFVQDVKDDDDQTVARLGPLAGGTTLHIFGYEDEITKLQAFIVGFTDKAAIKALAKSGAKYELMSPYGDLGDYYVKHVTFTWMNSRCQTLRSDLDEDAPVFQIDMELYRDE